MTPRPSAASAAADELTLTTQQQRIIDQLGVSLPAWIGYTLVCAAVERYRLDCLRSRRGPTSQWQQP